MAGFLMVAHAGLAQEMWAPKGEPAVYTPPHKPHTKLPELKKKHSGKSDWRELIVDDKHLRSEYIQAKPGTKIPRQMRPDTRTWWVIMDGQVRFDIETIDSFVASKGSMVQVPMQTYYTWEVIGDKPALIFETNVAGAHTLYESNLELPKIPGLDWIKVRFNGRNPGVWARNNKPHVTFDEVAKALEEGKAKGTQRIVEDDRGTANFIYGYNSKLPPLDPNNKGHYHPEGAEFWLIMKGQIRYPIEKVGVVIAEEGDVVYVPPYTFHAPRWWGDGASCRLAMNGFPYISHLFEPH
jgi:mannose-6-phosphate isomerase-like protein (cupin superfamily)